MREVTAVSNHDIGEREVGAPPTENAGANVRLRCATANVLTLLPHQEDYSYAKISSNLLLSKVQLLEQLFYDSGLDIVGIQEGRGKRCCIRGGLHYHMLIAAADEYGNHGVQCWLARSTRIRVIQWRVVLTTLMYAVVSLKNGAVSVIIVGHAPQSRAPEDVKDLFWNSFSETVSMLHNKYPCADWVGLIDANARTGSVGAQCIGTANVEREDRNGTRLRCAMAAGGFFLVNTFGSGSGPTWCSSRFTWSRIDYVFAKQAQRSRVVDCQVLGEVDLTMNAKQDHCAVTAVFIFLPSSVLATETTHQRFQFNKANVGCPFLQDRFHQEMWKFVTEPAEHVDDHLDRLNDHTRRAALRTFGSRRDMPRKPWISPATWSVVKQIAPLRRRICSIRSELYPLRAAQCFHSWVSATPLDSKPSWVAYGSALDAANGYGARLKAEAAAYATIFKLQSEARPSLEADRKVYLDSIALRAEAAAQRGDSHTVYSIVKSLAGAKVQHNPMVKRRDGSLTESPSEADARWQEHYACVFGGNVASLRTLREEPRLDAPYVSTLDVGPAATEAVYAKLGNNKGVGLDGIPAELLKAGGSALACKYSEVNARVSQNHSWPSQWRGGRIANVHKKKGDPQECDNSRGLLLADHAGKGLVGMIKDAVDPVYTAKMPLVQHGAVAGRGTDKASHLVRSAAAAAAMLKWSIFVLFVDLVKAFDKAIRQLVLGWGASKPADTVAYLRGLGVTKDAAEWISAYIRDRGHLFEQWNVNKTAAAMAQTLHEGAWFKVGASESVITSKTGGRQGCKLGGIIFNSAYSIALDIMAWELAKAGVAFRVRVPEGAFWDTVNEDNADYEDVVDVAFVDDECIVLLAKTPKLLDVAIQALLRILVVTFGNMHLAINWSPGKTEALLCYRGHGSIAAREQWRAPNGKLEIPVPSVPELRLHIVDVYKHLGTFCSASAETYRNALHRVQSAMSSYSPISQKVFGNELLSTQHRSSLLQSLIMSRLLHNVYICVVSSRDYIAYNGVYMRALRRIAGDSRYSSEVQHTDIQIRVLLKVPSVDCLIARLRLSYLGRVVRSRPRGLTGLLHMRSGDKRIPWVTEVANDCGRLTSNGVLPPTFPSFFHDPAAWHQLITNTCEWEQIIGDLFFYESVTDRRKEPARDDARALAFACSRCDKAFASQMALEAHCRVKHGDRLDIRRYVAGSLCPSCGVDFRERIRCISHLSDRRRPTCPTWVKQNVTPLPEAEVRRLDVADKVLRREAWRQGHTHHIARAPACRASA